ncbi:hypothetical protein DU502_06245 [Haloplanus aerogenes]|uniref:Uncharacterized protein n=1 Tax=Haloplanus aerogenes TaxID=660522 RepID=A0A3G8QVZ2_9EURY|nr:hypothetical protein DU502_06245 [Haloplanus aerogenes]
MDSDSFNEVSIFKTDFAQNSPQTPLRSDGYSSFERLEPGLETDELRAPASTVPANLQQFDDIDICEHSDPTDFDEVTE